MNTSQLKITPIYGTRGRGLGPFLFPALLMVGLLMSGCRVDAIHNPDPLPVRESQILSNPAVDGDIAFTPPDSYVVSSVLTTGSVLAGIDPVSGDEYRGFLDFPLRGSHGVPYSAVIESAILEIHINTVAVPSADAGVPLVLDLVAFQPPTLVAADFDRSLQPPLLSIPKNIVSADEGTFVQFDVTPLLLEAQDRALYDFQLRILLDGFAVSGLVEINDFAADTAPMLIITSY